MGEQGPRPSRGSTYVTAAVGKDRNLLGLPDGPWFPWSREFRWDLMPWNWHMRGAERRHRKQQQLIRLVEAAASTIGVVARDAGFAFNTAITGSRNDQRHHAVLYEAAPADVASHHPSLAEATDPHCVDLWIHWYPDRGQLRVDLMDFASSHGLEMPDRPDLVRATRRVVDDERQLRPVLEAWAAALRLWLDAADSEV